MALRAGTVSIVVIALAVGFAVGACGGSGPGKPELTCSASCREYRWNLETGSGANAEWCDPGKPDASGVAQCSSHSTDTSRSISCSLPAAVETCSGTVTDDTTGQQYAVNVTEDRNACSLTVVVEGVGACSAP